MIWLRHTFLLVVEVLRYAVTTRNFWIVPFLIILMLIVAVVGAVEAVAPYAIYPIF